MSEPRNRRCERDKGGREGRRKRVEELDERGGVSSVRVGRFCRRRHDYTGRAVAQLICVDVDGPRGDDGREEDVQASRKPPSPRRDVLGVLPRTCRVRYRARRYYYVYSSRKLVTTSASHLASVLDNPTRRWSFVQHVKICVP